MICFDVFKVDFASEYTIKAAYIKTKSNFYIWSYYQ